MERLTSNKPVADMMPMIELAHNSCYIDEKHNARYRDYEQDIDSRQLVRKLVKDMCDEDLFYMSDERFDQYMTEMLTVGVSDTIGLLAVFYRNLWATAELREKLKEYEDLEEQSMIIKLPCKVGDTVYVNGVLGCDEAERYRVIRVDYHSTLGTGRNEFYIEALLCADPDSSIAFYDNEFGKTVFLTKSEAEAKLKELRGNINGK
jgi:hypothetical protein